MANSIVQTLQIAVRRRLWRGQFVAAARLALWGSAGLMLLAVAVHLAARAVRVDTVCPCDRRAVGRGDGVGGDCGAPPIRRARSGRTVTLAGLRVQHVARNARRQAGGCRTPRPCNGSNIGRRRGCRIACVSSAERHDSARLSRPLLSVLVCAASGDDRPGAARHGSVGAAATCRALGLRRCRPPHTPDAERPASRELVSALASALRSAESRRASERRDDGRGAGDGTRQERCEHRLAHGPARRRAEWRTDHHRRIRFQAPSMMRPPRPRQHRLPAPAPAATPATAATIAPMLAFRGSRGVRSRCKDVNRANGVHRRKGRLTWTSRRRSTTIFRCIARRRSGRIPPSAAATPPPATDATPLTPTRAAYVQAWMKASRQRR